MAERPLRRGSAPQPQFLEMQLPCHEMLWVESEVAGSGFRHTHPNRRRGGDSALPRRRLGLIFSEPGIDPPYPDRSRSRRRTSGRNRARSRPASQSASCVQQGAGSRPRLRAVRIGPFSGRDAWGRMAVGGMPAILVKPESPPTVGHCSRCGGLHRHSPERQVAASTNATEPRVGLWGSIAVRSNCRRSLVLFRLRELPVADSGPGCEGVGRWICFRSCGNSVRPLNGIYIRTSTIERRTSYVE